MNSKDFLFLVAMLALVFLFQGDPDLWDLLHQKTKLWAESQA